MAGNTWRIFVAGKKCAWGSGAVHLVQGVVGDSLAALMFSLKFLQHPVRSHGYKEVRMGLTWWAFMQARR